MELTIVIKGNTPDLILEELKTILFHLECGTIPGLHIGDCYSEVIFDKEKMKPLILIISIFKN